MFDGYLDDPEANRVAFEGGWFHTGDVGYFDPDGFLYLVGRIKEQINRGGDKISPPEVDAVLLSHPGVVDAATFAMPHKRLGEEVAAAVVRRDDSVTEASIKDHAIERLAPHKVPRRVVFVDAIPREMGKVQRIGLDERLGLSTSRAAPASLTPPADDVERGVAAIWKELLDIDRTLGRDEDFFELGGDSFLGVQMLAAVDVAFAVQIPQSALVRSATLADLAEAIRDYANAPPASPLVPLQTEGGQTPLFWVSGGGGGVFGVTNLAFHLGSDQPVYAFQPIGADGKTAPVLDIHQMATGFVTLLREVQPGGPYVLGGHSFGGLVAFEMARQLEAMGETVAFLGLVEADTLLDRTLIDSARTKLRAARGQVSEWLGAERPEQRAILARMLARQRERARVLATRPAPAADIWLPRAQLGPALVTALREATRRYRGGPYHGPLTYFEARESAPPGRARRWRPWVQGPVEVVEVPGTHETCVHEPNIGLVARKLRSRLPGARPASLAAP